MLLFYIYIFMQLYLNEINAAGFDYKDTCKWRDYFPACGGRSQSPINLKLINLGKSGELPPLRWIGYDNVPMRMILMNNGHSIVLSGVWDPNSIPCIKDGPLTDAYIFEQLHFHWGPNNSVGSEHKINGNSFPLEMHMVHFKKQYRTFTNATNFSDGLAVVGLLFDIVSTGSDALTTILGAISGVHSPGEKFELDPFELSSFDGVAASVQFATYDGSLTTPPCSETVKWILPLNVLNVSPKQMDKFRGIRLNHDDIYNYRPTQPLNGRAIRIFTQWSKLYMSDVYTISSGI